MRGPIPDDGTPRSSGGIGADVRRSEDERFLTGRGRYLADIEVPRALHVVFVRFSLSPCRHCQHRCG